MHKSGADPGFTKGGGGERRAQIHCSEHDNRPYS